MEDPKLRLSLLKCSFSHGCLTDLLQDSTVSQHTMGIFDRDYITPQGSLLYFKKVKKKKKETHNHVHFILCEFFLNNGDIKP